MKLFCGFSYAVGLLNGKFTAKENVHSSLLAIHLLKRVRNQASVDVLWIKAHAGLWGNEMADRAAKAGATPVNERLDWKHNLMITDWGGIQIRFNVDDILE